MLRRLAIVLSLCLAAGTALAGSAFAGAVTSKPDPEAGKALAGRLCTNCHLVNSTQAHVNVDVPSFREIANKEAQTEGAIMARIVIPSHPMPEIPLTKREIADLAAYIMTLRDPGERQAQ
jgi:mono/diheme cytochrome c family protein